MAKNLRSPLKYLRKKVANYVKESNALKCSEKVEMNPLWQQKKLREFCNGKGIHVTAYSPLGGRGTLWGTNRVLDCMVLQEIAQAKGKTVAQVMLPSFLFILHFFSHLLALQEFVLKK